MEPPAAPAGLRGMTPRRLVRLACVVGAAAGLAACNAHPIRPSTSSSTSSTAGRAVVVPPSSATSTSTTSSTTSTTTAVASGPSRCKVSDLSATAALPQGAAGHIGQQVTFRNVSRASCTLFGYPGLAMLGTDGQALPTEVQRGPDVVVQPESPTLVTLGPGNYASFVLGYADATGYGNQSCPTSLDIEVTPPNAHGHLVIPDRVSAYGPRVGECGTIYVSPVYAGSGPQPHQSGG